MLSVLTLLRSCHLPTWLSCGLLLCGMCLAPAARAAETAPLSLEEAIATALRQNPQALIAQGNYQAAAARIWEQRSSWLPQLTLTGQVTGTYGYQTEQPPPPTSVDPMGANCVPGQMGCTPCTAMGLTARQIAACSSSSASSSGRYNATLTLRQLIYDFGHTSGLIHFAQHSAQAVAGDRDSSKVQIVLSAITAYYGVLQAEALNDVAVRNLEQQEQKLLQAEGFYNIGTKAEIDVLTAKTARAQARLQGVQAKNGIITSRIQLLLALGVTDATWMARPLVSGLPEALPQEGKPMEDLVDVALSHRPDYVAQRQRVAAQESQVVVARSGYFPTVSAQGSLALSGTTATTLNPTTQMLQTGGSSGFGPPLLSAVGFINLTWQFFDGLQTPYVLREQRALLDVAHANLEALRQQVHSGVEQAAVAVDNARESLQAAQAVVDQAELQLKTASGRYKEGVGSIIELGDAQVASTMARQQKVQADFNLAVARAQLQMQLGDLVRPGSDRQSR